MLVSICKSAGKKINSLSGNGRTILPALLTVLLLSNACGSDRNAGTEILWDKYGVPHIYGSTTTGMYYGFGWAQMNNHANLMLQLYAQARGRAAEYFGKDFLESDRKILLFELPSIARENYVRQDREFKAYLDAFVRGINDYAKAHPDAIGEKYRQVLPVTAEDVLAHTARVICLEFLAAEDIGNVQRITAPGSNSLAIGPSKSASGKAMLISNPHLPWSDFFIWFEAHVNAPGINAYGVSLVGMPVLTIAFNDDLGWTHTVNPIDASDRYELRLKDNGYVLDGRTVPFEKKEAVIRVRQDDGSLKDLKYEFKYSEHGPVAGEKGDRAYAVRIAGLRNPDIFEQYHKMAGATCLKEFESALGMLQNPMFNVMYADRAGNILYLFGGDIPVRPAGDFTFWHGTIDGSDSKYIWNRIHRYEDLPRVLNPPAGFLQNCNDAPWVCTWPPVLVPSDYPAYMAPLGTYWRAQRTINMVKDNPSVTYEQLTGYKFNTEMEPANRFLDDLLAAVRQYPDREAEEAAEVLRSWDRKCDTGSRGAVLFTAWWDQVGGSMFEVPWSQDHPVSTPSGLKDKQKAVDMLVKAARSVKEKYGSPDVAWGDVNRFRIGKYDFPANGGPDNCGVFRAMYFADDNDHKRRAVAGDTYIAVTEFGEKPKAEVVLSYGNATQPGSIHSGDQLEMLSEKKLRPALLERTDILKNLEKKENLNEIKP